MCQPILSLEFVDNKSDFGLRNMHVQTFSVIILNDVIKGMAIINLYLCIRAVEIQSPTFNLKHQEKCDTHKAFTVLA